MCSQVARLTRFRSAGMVFIRNMQHAAQTSMTDLIPVSSGRAVESAVRLLKAGHVIALPTDTIYGIAALAQNDAGIHQLYGIKKRDLNNPIAICVGKISDICLWGETDHLPEGLLESLLPGAVTVVLKRKPSLNPHLNPNCQLVGIRVPDYNFIQAVAELCNTPLALTSANISREPSPLSTSEFGALWPALAAVFDGGTRSSREGSTVIDLSVPGVYHIVRPGSALDSTTSTTNKYGLLQVKT